MNFSRYNSDIKLLIKEGKLNGSKETSVEGYFLMFLVKLGKKKVNAMLNFYLAVGK